MAGEAVAEGVAGHSLGDPCLTDRLPEGLLHMGLVEVIALALSGFRYTGQVGAWEKPLPDELPGAVFVFPFNAVKHEYTIIACVQITLMQVSDPLQLIV